MLSRNYLLAEGLSRFSLFNRFSLRGFTLLELMVAIMLFSMISAAAYKLLTSAMRAQEVTQSVLDELDKLQRAEIVLEKDLFQMARRSVRDGSGQQQSALKVPGTGGTLIEFTRSGWQNPLQVTRSTLQRVAYSLEGDRLIRYYWPVLDRAPGSNRIRQPVMSGVKGVKFRFLDEHKRWMSSWPPTQNLQQSASDEGRTKIPVAVELTIVHEKVGPMVTVVPLASYKPDQVNKQGSGLGNMTDQSRNSPWPSREGHYGH